MGTSIAYKYPFLSSAREALAGHNLSQSELKGAQERVIAAVEKRAVAPTESIGHLATYAGARVLLAVLNDNYTNRKWAMGEATAFASELQRENTATLQKVAQEMIPSLQQDGESYTMSVLDYAKNGRDLAHRQVEAGKVWLDAQEFQELMRKAIENRLLSTVPLGAIRQIPEQYKIAAEELHKLLPKETELIYSGELAGKMGAKELYLTRNCVQELRKGAGEGKRWYACMALSIALRHDRVPIEKAREVITEFAVNCSKGAQPFTAREAISTLEWAYKRDQPARLSCKTLISQGLIPDYCDNCPYKGGGKTKRGKGE